MICHNSFFDIIDWFHLSEIHIPLF